MAQPRRVLSLEKAVAVLRCFTAAESQFSLAQIVQRTGLPKSVAYRLIQTLEANRLLERQPSTPTYRIGITAFEIGALYLRANPTHRVAAEAVERLALDSGHTTYLGVLDRDDTLMIAVHEGAQPVRVVGAAGDRFPVETTALGKAILAALPESEVRALYERRSPAARPGRVPPTLDTLLDDLGRTRVRGWALSKEETFPGVYAIGAAVVTPDGAPVAGIGLAFPASGVEPDVVARLADQTCRAADTVSQRIALGGDGLSRLRAAGRPPTTEDGGRRTEPRS